MNTLMTRKTDAQFEWHCTRRNSIYFRKEEVTRE